ncbi:putative Ig domain-containing protein (plasmid) [Prescottella equi]|nr:putative Ig domain-containing protein [Prescottella equi]
MFSTVLDHRRRRTRGRPRLVRAALSGLAAAGVAVALAAPAVAAPVGAPVALPGTVTAWGWDNNGQVSGAPTGGGYTAIAAGDLHSLALTADGHITAWGLDNHGQVSFAPTGGGYTAIAAGSQHSLALDARSAPALTGTPPAATVGQPYSHTFTVTGYPAPTVALTAGTLPDGLTLTPSGVLSGTPTTGGRFEFTLTASNGVGAAAVLPVTVDIESISTGPMPIGSLGSMPWTS